MGLKEGNREKKSFSVPVDFRENQLKQVPPQKSHASLLEPWMINPADLLGCVVWGTPTKKGACPMEQFSNFQFWPTTNPRNGVRIQKMIPLIGLPGQLTTHPLT